MCLRRMLPLLRFAILMQYTAYPVLGWLLMNMLRVLKRYRNKAISTVGNSQSADFTRALPKKTILAEPLAWLQRQDTGLVQNKPCLDWPSFFQLAAWQSFAAHLAVWHQPQSDMCYQTLSLLPVLAAYSCWSLLWPPSHLFISWISNVFQVHMAAEQTALWLSTTEGAGFRGGPCAVVCDCVQKALGLPVGSCLEKSMWIGLHMCLLYVLVWGEQCAYIVANCLCRDQAESLCWERQRKLFFTLSVHCRRIW